VTNHPLPTAASADAPEPHAISEAKRLANAASAHDEPAVLTKAKIQASTGLTGRTVLLPTEEAAAYQLGFEFSFADIEAYSSGRIAVLDIGYAAFKRDSAGRNRMQTAA
jgi:hypothetical protein